MPGDVGANVATATDLVARAADRGARLVVLPELFLTGYDEEVWAAGVTLAPDDARLDPLREAARRDGIVVLAGAALPAPPATTGRATPGSRTAPRRATLSLLMVTDAGASLSAYDKQHLCGPEAAAFEPGTGGASLVLDGWELGLGVCYDGSFPEHARAAAAAGAAAYVLSAAFYAGAEHRRDVYAAARALDNGMYVVVAGLTGRCGSGRFSGGSGVYDPEGRPVTRLGDEPGLAIADLDPAVVRQVREDHPMLRERLADLGDRRRHRVG